MGTVIIKSIFNNSHKFITTILQVITESVKLSDEEQMKEQSDENGDVFQWMKLQAERGVFSAQVDLYTFKFNKYITQSPISLTHNLSCVAGHFFTTHEAKM